MTPRLIKDSDNEELARWWTAQGWPAMPVDKLPSTGWIVEGTVAAWMYLPISGGVAIIEWIVANPEARNRGEALKALLSHMEEYAEWRGYSAVFTGTKHPSLITRLQSAGYVVGDEGVTHLMKVLHPK